MPSLILQCFAVYDNFFRNFNKFSFDSYTAKRSSGTVWNNFYNFINCPFIFQQVYDIINLLVKNTYKLSSQ